MLTDRELTGDEKRKKRMGLRIASAVWLVLGIGSVAITIKDFTIGRTGNGYLEAVLCVGWFAFAVRNFVQAQRV